MIEAESSLGAATETLLLRAQRHARLLAFVEPKRSHNRVEPTRTLSKGIIEPDMEKREAEIITVES